MVPSAVTAVIAAVLVAALCLLSVARLANPGPYVKAAFVSGALIGDEAAYPTYAGLGRVQADCQLAGDLLAAGSQFDRYLLAPQMPFDRDRILGTCQMSRDLAYRGSRPEIDLRPLTSNPAGLRAWLRLSLAVAPMSLWQILMPLMALAIGAGLGFLLWRRRSATVTGLGLLGLTSLMSATFSAMSPSLGVASLLWPLAVAAALLPKKLSKTTMATLSAALGASAVLFDYGSGLGLTVLICYLCGLATRDMPLRDLLTAAAAYTVAALALILLLALANVLVRGPAVIDGLRYISNQFTDLAVVISSGGGAIPRAGTRVWGWVADTGGGFALAAYALIALVVFGGWAAHLRTGQVFGATVLLSAGLAIGWCLLNFDRISGEPMQFLSAPLLLGGLALLSVLVALRPAVSLKLEPAS
ncbi:hypothetical protein ABAC402_15475 [Asticcacaulis sp. AC402]|nr:hypothetical protein ABAC402_15475 [Asticcacaulis sp. AC402]